MLLFKLNLRRILILSILSLGYLTFLPGIGEAQLLRNSLSRRLPRQWDLSNGIGAPANREGGATRGPQCLASEQKFTALVPASGKIMTAEAYPSFFGYLPKTSATGVESIVRNGEDEEIYRTEYPLNDNGTSESGRIIKLKLPEVPGVTALEVGKEYTWELVLICDRTDRSADISVQATIERIPLDPNLSSNLSKATAEEKVLLYSENRLWSETLETLYELIRNNPNDPSLKEAWTQLFDSVGLKSISQNTLP
jgi:hypothetical protein